MDALQDLNRDGISLAGVDISKAYLPELNLEDAELGHVDLTRADLTNAILSGADLAGANLFNTELDGANLAGAVLTDANLAGVYLRGANIMNIEDWRRIKSIEYANIYGVKNAPQGFEDWATLPEQGALRIENYETWIERKPQKMQDAKSGK